MARPIKPFFLDLHRQIDDMFDELIYRPWAIAGPRAWQPSLDVVETPDAYVVVIDLPGVAAEDVNVLAGERSLTISGQRPALTFEDAIPRRSERPVGAFERSVELPQPVDAEKVRAEFQGGMCRIRLPKKQADQPPPPPHQSSSLIRIMLT